MDWFHLSPRGHHGYPQPEDSFFQRTFADACSHCGSHGAQLLPYRFSSRDPVPKSQFMQMNWVFDTYFVTPDVAADIAVAGITGVFFSDPVHNRTGTPLGTRFQLHCSEVRPAALVAELPVVTCRAGNEESHLQLKPRCDDPEITTYCGTIKHHPPTELGVSSASLDNAPDIFQAAEWFGSGGSAWRQTIVSQRFADLLSSRRWRGVRALPIRLDVQSHRAS